MLFVENRLKINSAQSEISIRMNLNQSGLELICTEFSTTRVWIDSDSFGLSRIDSDFQQTRLKSFFGLVRNKFLFETFTRAINSVYYQFYCILLPKYFNMQIQNDSRCNNSTVCLQIYVSIKGIFFSQKF